MVTPNSVGRARTPSATIAALAIGLAACGTEDSPPPSNDATSVDEQAACSHVDAPMVEIPTPYPAQPLVRIPQPPGWERSTEFDDETIRFILVDGDSIKPQNIATVTVGRLPEPADADPQAILDDLQSDMMEDLAANNYPTDYETTETTVCGLPARKHSRAPTPSGLGGGTTPGRTASSLNVISKHDGDVYWIQVVVGIQPDNATDARDAEMILNGFQVLPPPNG